MRMRSSVVEIGVQQSMPMGDITSSRSKTITQPCFVISAIFLRMRGLIARNAQVHKEANKGHGRLEVREIWTSTQMNQWFEKEWARIAQVCADP